MTWLWIGLAAAGVLGVVAYWQLILAEGTYLGPRVVARTYDWIARRYDTIKQFNPRDEGWFVAGPLLQALEGVECPLILDVATGTGRLPLALLRERFASAGGRIVGLDLSRGMLRQAQAKLLPYSQQVDLVWQDASRLPFEDEAFDAVTCLESLEFMPRPREVLAEMVRVLAPGGVLLVTNRVGREAHFLPRRAMSRPAFEAALAALGLRDEQVRPWQIHYDLAIARKEGAGRTEKQGSTSLAELLRCPRCQGTLQRGVSSLACPACGQTFPIRDGIVHLADSKRRGEL